MKKTYTIYGMTCNGCKSTIHQNLNDLPEIESVEVNLEKGEAIIFAKSDINISKLQNALPSKFHIEEKLVDDLLSKTESGILPESITNGHTQALVQEKSLENY